MVDYHYSSVGRNGNMLLNLSLDTRRLIPDDQLAALSQMAQVVNDTFAQNLAVEAKFAADRSNPTNAPSLAHDGNLDTWWEAAPGHTSGTFTLTLPAAVTFDVVSLQEAIDHRGQRIEAFVIETRNGSAWTAPTTVDEQTTVGHMRLIRLAVPVSTDQMRIRITSSRLEPTLAEVGLFKQSLPRAPEISDRSRDGLITVTHPHHLPIVYTVDGSAPSAKSPVYESPILLPQGVDARFFRFIPLHDVDETGWVGADEIIVLPAKKGQREVRCKGTHFAARFQLVLWPNRKLKSTRSTMEQIDGRV